MANGPIRSASGALLRGAGSAGVVCNGGVFVPPPPPPGALPVLSLPSAASAVEGGAVTVTVAKAGAGACSVLWRTLDNTATGGADYTATPSGGVTISFAADETAKSVTVPIAADAANDPNETFRIVLVAGSEAGCTLGNATCTVTILDAATQAALFSTALENADTVPSLADQEMAIGQPFRKGDVPAGTALGATIDGARIPLQVSNRIFWSDGSLKHAQIRFLVPPVIPAGGSKAMTWVRVAETWDAHDAPLHGGTAAVTGTATFAYNFPNWAGRSRTNVLTAERGPKTFSSADLLGSANAAWVERVMGGPLVSEWRATDMAKLANGTKDAHFGCLLYARAWGGTAARPKRIQFLFRTMYGWSDGVPADQQGIRASLELRVNGTLVRGGALNTSGWTARDSYNGGFYASCGPTGKMDWFDVATNQFFTPPNLVYRHNVAYGVQAKFFPPYDVNNPAYSPYPGMTYVPQARGGLREIQDAVADADAIPWTNTTYFARAQIAHARPSVADLVSQSQVARVTAWGMAALGSLGFNRQTRKIICHLPTAKNPDPVRLGASVYDGTQPQTPPAGSPSYNPYVQTQDTPHFPQVCLWPYLTEGDQHFLDLLYAEATLPGIFCPPASGFHVPSADNAGGPKVAIGGVYFQGQTRGVGHGVRPILVALALGHPADPHHALVRGLWSMFVEAREAHIRNQDWWRTSIRPNPDGRNFADIKMYPMDASQEPQYKLWMHCFSLHSCSYGAAITEDPEAARLATWWAHVPTVLCGGWHDDTNHLWKPDPSYAGSYYHLIANTGTGGTNNDRRPWAHLGQWRGEGPVSCTYKADGQTIVLPNPAHDGMIVTVTGIHATGEPILMVDASKIPSGLTRGIPYYAVQSSGNGCKLSLTLGGAPVTFATGGADMVGQCARTMVFNYPGHPMRAASSLSIDDNSYHVQITAALDMYQHYVDPDDNRVRLARQKMRALKAARGGGHDVRGLTTVPA